MFQIAAANSPAGIVALRSSTKKISKDVFITLVPSKAFGSRLLSPLLKGLPLLVFSRLIRIESRLKPFLSEFVVELPFFFIAEAIIGMRNIFEALFRLLIAWIEIGVPFPGQLAVDFLDLFLRRTLRDA